MSMLCPKCGSNTKVICTSTSDEGEAVGRRRVCQDCGETVFTLELEAVAAADVTLCREILAGKVYACRERKRND